MAKAAESRASRIPVEKIKRKVKSLFFFFISNLASTFGALGSGATIATSLPPGASFTSHLADMKLVRDTPDLNDLKLPHVENLPIDLKEQKEDRLDWKLRNEACLLLS